MADEPTQPDEPTAPAVETSPEPVAVASPDPIAEIRERLARLEGENQALRTQVATQVVAPRADPAPVWTVQSARAAYDAGQITEDQRTQIIADLQVQAGIAKYAETRRVEDSQAAADLVIQSYIRAYPALSDPQSPLRQEVAAELRQMQSDEGANPQDLRAQARAVKSILGPLTTQPGSTARRGIPIGAAGIPGSGTPTVGGKPDPLKGVPADIIADWKTLGAKLDDPVEAARYAERYHGMLARRSRRTQGVA